MVIRSEVYPNVDQIWSDYSHPSDPKFSIEISEAERLNPQTANISALSWIFGIGLSECPRTPVIRYNTMSRIFEFLANFSKYMYKSSKMLLPSSRVSAHRRAKKVFSLFTSLFWGVSLLSLRSLLPLKTAKMMMMSTQNERVLHRRPKLVWWRKALLFLADGLPKQKKSFSPTTKTFLLARFGYTMWIV